jgi:hypothetical protein
LKSALAAALLVAGCYNPAVPSGGYRCSESDQACPTGQHCSCGLCVNQDSEAACSFAVTADATTVHEHEPFSVTVTAKAKDGSPATGFNDTVDLSFRLADGTRWADVRPATVKLVSGTAQLMVSVNRESIPPLEPSLTASFAGSAGASPGIEVLPVSFVKDATPAAQAPFGWANTDVYDASVVADANGFRMYFDGFDNKMVSGIGVATSTDGKTFKPTAAPVFPPTGSLISNKLFISGFGFQNGTGWQLAFQFTESMGSVVGDIGLATSPDGLQPFQLGNGGNAILRRADCPYCDFTVWFPSLLRAPAPAGSDGGTGDWLMYFGAARCGKPPCGQMLGGSVSMSVGRAHSADGVTFTPEPAPVLNGEQGGEAYLASPQVVLDGSIYKMWYSFSRNLASGDPCQGAVAIGYATSSDGFYWVRSPSNPVLSAGGTGWDASAPAILLGSVIPVDGHDFESGLLMFYSTFQNILLNTTCVPVSVGRAVGH